MNGDPPDTQSSIFNFSYSNHPATTTSSHPATRSWMVAWSSEGRSLRGSAPLKHEHELVAVIGPHAQGAHGPALLPMDAAGVIEDDDAADGTDGPLGLDDGFDGHHPAFAHPSDE